MATCSELATPTACEDRSDGEPASPAAENQPQSMEREFDFVEKPTHDFFCPVSLEYLLEPQLTFCCGHHLSLQAAKRLQEEGKPCPMCNSEEWSAVLDKYHRRKAREVRVRCWYRNDGCVWEGEVNGLTRHADSCKKRPWECEYCALKCIIEDGKENHWPTCTKFPEPCPNSCDVGSVERCNVEQHRSVCPLEPVACEMKEFGCSVVVPRIELATHMRESALQHLTAMTMLNLCLTKQLQLESAERNKNIKQLQEDVKQELTEMKDQIQEVKHICKHVEEHAMCSGCEILFTDYRKNKNKLFGSFNRDFSSPWNEYTYRIIVNYGQFRNAIGVSLALVNGKKFPATFNVRLELLNQAEDHHHVVRREKLHFKKVDICIGNWQVIDDSLMTYSDLEEDGGSVRYMMNDCLKFRVHIDIVSQPD